VIQESFKGIEYQGKIFPLLKKIGPQESDMIDISGIFFSEPDCTGYLKNTRKHYIEKSKQINGSKSRASNYFSTPRLKSLRSKPENIQHNQTRLSAKQLAFLRKRLGLGPLKKTNSSGKNNSNKKQLNSIENKSDYQLLEKDQDIIILSPNYKTIKLKKK